MGRIIDGTLGTDETIFLSRNLAYDYCCDDNYCDENNKDECDFFPFLFGLRRRLGREWRFFVFIF